MASNTSDKSKFSIELGDIQCMLVLPLRAQLEAFLANPKGQTSWTAEVQGQTVALAGPLAKGEADEAKPVVAQCCYWSKRTGRMFVRHVAEQADPSDTVISGLRTGR